MFIAFPGHEAGIHNPGGGKGPERVVHEPGGALGLQGRRGHRTRGAHGLPARDVQAFLLWLERYWQDLFDGLKPPYGAREDFSGFLTRLVRLLAARYADRPEDLKALDLERNLTPDWFQSERRVSYVFYADRFAGALADVAGRLDYLEELGANYVHVMPLLASRSSGLDDGGYAVSDYRKVRGPLGTMEDLRELCTLLRDRGMSLCLDFVLNHCAREHGWAEGARRRVPEYEEMFHIFPDRSLPDEYEKMLPEVFSETTPGNFTRIEETGKWVWTTFNDYQWDLNWANPRVFVRWRTSCWRFVHPHPLGPLFAIHNFIEETRYVSLDLPRGLGMASPVARISGRPPGFLETT